MAMKKVLNLFQAEVRRAQLSRDSPVAVALSGGSDSVALLWLAKQVFSDVTGITVDHRLHDASSEEAAMAGKLAAGLGAKHQVRTVDWQGSVPGRYQLQKKAREKRYGALLECCQTLGVGHLMTAHHLDDQIETMLYRMSWGSSLDGMAGMYVLSRRLAYPQIQIFRPLLRCRKDELRALCREAGLEWVEDASNTSLHLTRGFVYKMLEEDPTLTEGLKHMQDSISQTRKAMTRTVAKGIRSVVSINMKYGYVVVNKPDLLALPIPVSKRVIGALLKYISCNIKPVLYRQLDDLVSWLPHLDKNTCVHGCCIFPVHSEEVLGIAPAVNWGIKPLPISVGESVLWNNRWTIELLPIFGSSSRQKRQFFIRNFMRQDYELVRRGVRVVRRAKLPPIMARCTLPVIEDQDRNVALIPHFKYKNRDFGISATVKYTPRLTLDSIVNQYD